MGKPIYIKHCCYFCTEREVNCKGCAIAKEGIEEITKKCQKHLEAGICTETFGDTINKNMCFTPDDKDIETLEGKSTSALSVNNKKEETRPSMQGDPEVIRLGEKVPKKPEKPKVSKEDQTNKVVDALKEAAKNGDIDIKSLLEKLGKRE